MRIRKLLLLSLFLFLFVVVLSCGVSAAYSYPPMPSDWEAITVQIGDDAHGYTNLPLADYPDGAYWDPDKDTMSPVEAWKYGINTSYDINLKGWQCVGFARYTFAACFYRYPQNVGMDTGLAYESSGSSRYYTVGSLPAGYSAAQVKALMMNAVPGSVMRIRGHSMVIMAIFSDGVLVYDANFSSSNEVDVRKYTWASFADRLGSRGIEVLQAPAYFPGYNYYYYGIPYESAGSAPVAVTFVPEGGYAEYTSRTYNSYTTFGSLPNASKTNRTLAGWYCDGVRYTEDSIVPAVPYMTMYAYWNIFEYRDVYEFDWFASNVELAAQNGLISRDVIFRPNDSSLRCEFVTVLGRLYERMNGTTINNSAPWQFRDLVPGAYYCRYVGWAYDNQIVLGTSDTTFSPAEPVTRQQIATLLYRFAMRYGLTNEYTGANQLGKFRDGYQTSNYAVTPMNWAISIGLFKGDNNGLLDPTARATRAQMVTIMNRFIAYYGG